MAPADELGPSLFPNYPLSCSPVPWRGRAWRSAVAPARLRGGVMRRTVYRCVLAIAFGTISARGGTWPNPKSILKGRTGSRRRRRKIRAFRKSRSSVPQPGRNGVAGRLRTAAEVRRSAQRRGRIQVEDVAFAEPGRIPDESALRRRWQPCIGHPRAPWPRRALPSWRPTT